MDLYEIFVVLIVLFTFGFIIYNLLYFSIQKQFERIIRDILEGHEYDLNKLNEKIEKLEKKINEIEIKK